jgi:hypothetical protein
LAEPGSYGVPASSVPERQRAGTDIIPLDPEHPPPPGSPPPPPCGAPVPQVLPANRRDNERAALRAWRKGPDVALLSTAPLCQLPSRLPYPTPPRRAAPPPSRERSTGGGRPGTVSATGVSCANLGRYSAPSPTDGRTACPRVGEGRVRPRSRARSPR